MNYEQFEELYSEVINDEWNDQKIKHILIGSLVNYFIDFTLQEDN
jgi:hypothetical protein